MSSADIGRLWTALRGCVAEADDAGLLLSLSRRPMPHTRQRYLTHVRLAGQHRAALAAQGVEVDDRWNRSPHSNR